MESERQNRRPAVGLALGGGVVRGIAHVGALSVLAAAGIPIDYVAGASAGAIMGALYCAGLSVAEIEYIASRIGWGDVARPVWPREGLVSFAPLEQSLRQLLGDITFAELEIPFAAVATDLECGRPVTLQEGPVAPAVRASASVPGIVAPHRIGARLLGDGAISNNLPVSVVREMGADLVIAVDIFQPAYVRNLGPLGRGLSALEILIDRSGGGIDDADFLIQPELAGVTYISFAHWRRLLQLGREAAEPVVPDILAALGHA